MSRTVDARGLECPRPVILTRNAMAEADEVITIVDSKTARDNVRRMAEKAGRRVTVESNDGAYMLHIVADGAAETASVQQQATNDPARVSLVLVVSDTKMGRGDHSLGEILMRSFFHTLGEVEPRPETIIFVNDGVWLAIDNSPVLEDLLALESQGVTILACGTCLGHFGITQRVAVGQVSNMYNIAETMLGADKVVNL